MGYPFGAGWPFRILTETLGCLVYLRSVNNGLEQASLAIADVSGYTGYLAGVELDHAQDILADLIGTVVSSMAPFELSKLEGDAAFMFLSGETIDGSSVQDAVEGTYVAFRRRLRDIQQASSCECNACVRIPSLDLKFVVHHGAIARQRMVGLEELVGADVILVHRLLKNDVAAATGVGAYVLYTQAILEAADVDPGEQGLTEHHEITDVVGEVTAWVRDLEAHWQEIIGRRPRSIDEGSLVNETSWLAPTSTSVTFEWLTSPAKRQLWDSTITKFDETTEDGRRGAGTTNHCMHGENAIREQILEWRPPDFWLMKGFAAFIPGEPGIYLSDELEAQPDGGTRVISRVGRLEDDPTDPEILRQMVAYYLADYEANLENLKQHLAEVARQTAASRTPDLPASAGRFLTEPIVAS
jgi:hypothetical protein